VDLPHYFSCALEWNLKRELKMLMKSLFLDLSSKNS